MKRYILILILVLSAPISNLFAGGTVYLVIGSDTAIWDGMSTNRYNNYYNVTLYTDPMQNAFKVMDPSFRSQFIDSDGNPLKMTWWMMAGNIFRYATNKNVPFPNIMTLYLMKKYHGKNLIINGDELTLHYHTFFWSDYDLDGQYFWNQSKTFNECKDDFNFTLAQFLLEEEVFPVSFRSGWHFMDNDWQHYLDHYVLPYSLHNDYPHKRTFDTEPIDNIFDWSEAPGTWIPYNPSYENYQIQGNRKSWNVRSASFQRTIAINLIDSIFVAAEAGEDQVACIWAHLPESDFLENIIKIDSLVQRANNKYSEVTFKYCTAIEAMQLWRETQDNTPPNLTITDNNEGEGVSFTIQSDETIFQSQPFVAIKDIYNKFNVVRTVKTGENEWRTSNSFPKKELVKVGVTATDDAGNQAMEFIEYLPNDVYLDNLDDNYSENTGSWNSSSTNSWGTNSRTTSLSSDDTISANWRYSISNTGYYNIFTQIPEIDNPAEKFSYIISENTLPIDTIFIEKGLISYNWNYLSTKYFETGNNIDITLMANGNDQLGKTICADVIKISALVKEKEINVSGKIVLPEVVINEAVNYELNISNHGIKELNLFGIFSLHGSLISKFDHPIKVLPMSSIDLPLEFLYTETGATIDTLYILSDDPKNSKISTIVSAEVDNYFSIVDNEDIGKYFEFGEWQTSVATSHGESSRFAFVNQSTLASVSFTSHLQEPGLYDIKFIVPKTVNAANKAIYEVSIENLIIDSVLIDQNDGSGVFITIGSYFLPTNSQITLKIFDSGECTNGLVLRADAIKFQLVEELLSADDRNNDILITDYRLEQNFPNPFNPSTTIRFQIPKVEHVTLTVYNLLGEKVRSLANETLSSGNYSIIWDGLSSDGKQVSSGPYFYRITAGSYSESKKMIYLR